MTHSSTSHEDISRRAYQLWEEAGHPDGLQATHWLQAERELEAHHDTTGKTDPNRGKSVEPPALGRHVPEKAAHSSDYSHPGVTTDSLHHQRNR